MKRIPLLFSTLLMTTLLSAQLLPNGDFEAYGTHPHYFRLRSSTAASHGVETDPSLVRNGNACAKFQNNSGSDQACYYYGTYDLTGSNPDFLAVRTGEVYEFSFFYKLGADFTGEGVAAQVLFANENDDFMGNVRTDYEGESGDWQKVVIRGSISEPVRKIAIGIYYQGQGTVWVDDANITRLSEALVPNSGFEFDEAPIPGNGLPDYFTTRYSEPACHLWETNFENTYLGTGAAHFNHISATPTACYFYGAYNDQGTSREGIPVCPGDSYYLRGFTRVDETDFTGNGLYLSAIFYDEQDAFLARFDSPQHTHSEWTRQELDFEVPADAVRMLPSVEYRGAGKAWADQLVLRSANLVRNSSWETNAVAPHTIADYWRPRNVGIADIEVDVAEVYTGKQCGLFSYNGTGSGRSYCYGPYTADGSTKDFLPVEPGEEYELSAFTRCESSFIGSGTQVSIIFWEEGQFLSRVNSAWENKSAWGAQTITTLVPEHADEMSYSVEYYGVGKAWFDEVTLRDQEKIWFRREAPIDYFVNIDSVATIPAAVDEAAVIARFNALHHSMEGIYNQNGTWGYGYSPACTNPLIRMSANAALGYLGAYCSLPDSTIFLDRACAALHHLLADQLDNGGFNWYTVCDTSQSYGAILYEGSIATRALLKGYEVFGDIRYLEAARDFCDYLMPRSLHANANFMGFALWALSEYLKVYSDDPNPSYTYEEYREKALTYFDALHGFQTPGGMWSDLHNQHIWYHGIIARGLVNFQSILEVNHPKYGALKHATHKALNHIRRSQRNHGKVWQHPYEDGVTISGFPIDAMVMAHSDLYPSSMPLAESLDLFSHGVANVGFEAVQGHHFATVGQFLFYFYDYNNSLVCNVSSCDFPPPNPRLAIPTFELYPNPARMYFDLKGTGTFELYNGQGQLLSSDLESGRHLTGDWSPGVYLLRQGQEVKRLVVVR